MKGLLFTYLITFGGAAAGLFNPYTGLLAYICLSILKPESLWYWQADEMPPNSSRLVGVATLIGWALQGFGRWDFGKAWAVVLCLLAFLGWGALSSTQCRHPELGWDYLIELLKVVMPILVGLTMIDDARKLYSLAWVIVLSLGYVCLEMNLTYALDKFNRINEIGFGGMDNNCFGIAANTGLGLAIFLSFSANKWWKKGVAVTCALSMAHVVLLTFSRGGMVGLVVLGVSSFFLLRMRPWHYAAFAVGVLVMFRLAGPEVVDRFLSSFKTGDARDWSAESRIQLWTDCLDCMIKHPLFGVGPRHFPVIAPEYGWPLHKEAHTLWLQVGAEQGFLGLAFLLLYYVVTGGLLVKLLRDKGIPKDSPLRPLAAMVLASLIGFAVSAQFVSLIGLELPYYVAMLGAGTLILASRPAADAEGDPVDHPAVQADEAAHTLPVPTGAAR